MAITDEPTGAQAGLRAIIAGIGPDDLLDRVNDWAAERGVQYVQRGRRTSEHLLYDADWRACPVRVVVAPAGGDSTELELSWPESTGEMLDRRRWPGRAFEHAAALLAQIEQRWAARPVDGTGEPTAETATLDEGPAQTPLQAHDATLTPMLPNFPTDYPAAYRKLAGPPPDGLGRRPRQDEVARKLNITHSTFKRYRKRTRLGWPPI
jgi:hypothetical protein